MKTPIVTALLVLISLPLQSQDLPYKTLAALGWKMENLAIPPLEELDTGQVDYLVTLNRKGTVTHLKILKNSFSKAAEKLWRKSVMKSSFVRGDGNEPLTFKGTLNITRSYCADDGNASEKQLEIFRKTQAP